MTTEPGSAAPNSALALPHGVTVVVPAHNAARHLPATLDAIFRSAAAISPLEVIVVNDSSTDETQAIIDRYPCIALRCTARNRAAARNVGLQRATGDLVAFIDADTVIHEDWCEKMLRSFRCAGVGGVQGALMPLHDTTATLLNTYRDDLFHRLADPRTFERLFPIVATGACIYRREALLAVHGFDESLTDCEDMDLSWKVLAAGFALAFNREAVARTGFYPETFLRYLRRVFQRGVGAYSLFDKWRGVFDGTPGALALRTSPQAILQTSRNSPTLLRLASLLTGLSHFIGCLTGWASHIIQRPSRATLHDESRRQRQRVWRCEAEGRRYRFADSVGVFLNGGDVTLIRMRGLDATTFRDVGADILRSVLAGHSQETEILQRIADAYAVTSTVALQDYRGFIAELATSHWIEVLA